MNYELAKELKDAGFPQYGSEPRTGSLSYTEAGDLIEFDDSFWRNGEPAYSVPTLSELIEAFRELEALTKEHSQAGDEWCAVTFYGHSNARGATPLEAAARLWLVLHRSEATTQ